MCFLSIRFSLYGCPRVILPAGTRSIRSLRNSREDLFQSTLVTLRRHGRSTNRFYECAVHTAYSKWANCTAIPQAEAYFLDLQIQRDLWRKSTKFGHFWTCYLTTLVNKISILTRILIRISHFNSLQRRRSSLRRNFYCLYENRKKCLIERAVFYVFDVLDVEIPFCKTDRKSPVQERDKRACPSDASVMSGLPLGKRYRAMANAVTWPLSYRDCTRVHSHVHSRTH